jgi:hypothetical protein
MADQSIEPARVSRILEAGGRRAGDETVQQLRGVIVVDGQAAIPAP